MLMEKMKKYLLSALVAAAAFTAAWLRSGLPFTAQTALAGVTAILSAMTLILVLLFNASMRITLYAYKNISFVGMILFTGGFATVMLIKLILGFFSEPITYAQLYALLLDYPKQFAFCSAMVILVIDLLVGVSNIALMRHEGVKLHNALGAILAVLYFGGAVLVMLLPRIIAAVVPDPKGFAAIVFGTIIPLFFLLLLCYLQGTFLGTLVMGWITARAEPDRDNDYIIILGCSISKKGGLLPLLKGRVNRAVRFAWEQEIATGKPLKYVPSGGQGADEVMSEGSAMELYLLSHGAEDYEVFPEKKSVSTYENMLFSKRIIDELQPGAKIAFATTNYHILRSGMLARRAGMDAKGIAGDTKWYFWPNGFMREFVAILTMHRKAHSIVAAVCALVALAAGVVVIWI